jgi:peptide/nickel transport system permease protein
MSLSKKNAFLLSALIPGSGQLYRNERAKGLFLLIGFWGGLLFTLAMRGKCFGAFQTRSIDQWVASLFLILGLVCLWLFSLLDTYTHLQRKKHNRGVSQWHIARERFESNPMAMVGLITVILLYVVAILAPFLAPYDPNAQVDVLRTRYVSPSKDHPMGTDKFGRDIYSRILYGSRISLVIGLIAVGLAVTIGTLIGAVAGYVGGIIDNLIMRIVDVALAFPRLVLVLTIVALLEPKIWLIILVIGFTGWMPVSRLVRAEILSLKERDFVQAAQALGAGTFRIILRHLLPNAAGPIIVATTLMIGDTILLEAALSFLGLGVQPPTASWGSIINQGRDTLLSAWWISTFPGLVIVITVVGYNLLGDGLRDALDPKGELRVK